MTPSLTFDTSDSTSSSLLSRLRQRDPEAWSRLTTIYGPLVYRWARHARLQSEDAGDSAAEKLTGDTDKAEVAAHLKNVTELCRELNTRWFEVTQRVFQSQNELLARCAEAADKVS